MTCANKLIILDRDGVINYDSPEYIKSAAEWQPIPGSINAIVNLCKAGFKVAVTTNQSGIGRGLFNLDALTSMHNKMLKLITDAGGFLAGIFFCPHLPEDNCSCRKPKPGLIYQVFAQLGVKVEDLNSPVIVIGDSLRDLQSAKAANCCPILVSTGNGAKTLSQIQADLNLSSQFADLLVCQDLLQASEVIINNHAHTLVS